MRARPPTTLASDPRPTVRTSVRSGVRQVVPEDDGTKTAPHRPILVVDDDEGIRAVLEGQGYDVVEAADGRSAIDWLTSSAAPTPGLVLLDVEMPVMNGWDLLALMRRYYRLAKIPVVLVTGRSAHDEHAEALARGDIVACLHKPLDLDALVDAVDANAARE